MDQAEGIHNQNIAPMGAQAQAQDGSSEKVLKQSEVNELLVRLKQEAYEKGKRDAAMTATQMQMQSEGQPPQTQQQQMGGMPQVTEDQIRQMIADEAQKQTHMARVQSTLDNFGQQMTAGKGNYSDFDETVANLGNLQAIPQVVQLATDTGIAGDVMYELGRNPGKVASLTTLAYINPHLAQVEMKKLADSIKTNQQASKSPTANEPLSQVKPSTTVGTDNGVHTVRDLRRRASYKG
jgi:hypothetical protein